MRCSVFELHHQVLQAWALYRTEREKAPVVLTLDYHTDTLPAFGRIFPNDEDRRKRRIHSVHYDDPESVRHAIIQLRHDEHLDLAVQSGIVSESLVISHFPPCLPVGDGIRTVSPDWGEQNTLLNDPMLARPLADSVLEDSFLSPLLKKLAFIPEEHRGYILDIDLDYFLTIQSVRPVRNCIWNKLKKYAGLITVSREDDWIRLLRLDAELCSERLLNEPGLFRHSSE